MAYNPNPPRVWSRVQNQCSLITNNNQTNNDEVVLPYDGIVVPVSEYYRKIEQINKGNILQYKANSAQLTKQQIYSQMAKGMWTNRNTTWATQSQSYTNPNTQSLKRSGAINITTEGVPTTLPVTCPQPTNITNNSLPTTINQPGPSEPPLPPPPPTPSPNNSSIPLSQVPSSEPTVIQDEGSLLCSIVENICTGETFIQPANNNCNLTTDSDVPGPIQELCWYNNIQTWYPRQRLTMTNSGDKWPQGYKGFTSALKPYTPELTATVDTTNCTKVNLSWTYEVANCLPVDTILIYLIDNSQPILSSNLIATLEPTNNTYQLTVTPGNYTIFIKTSSGGIESQQSNSVNVVTDNNFTIVGNSGTKLTMFINGSNKGFIIESTYSPTFGESYVGTATLTACAQRNDLNLLIIGGGGGGGAGYSKSTDPNGYSGGGGGGGAGNILITNYTNPINTLISLQIGVGGGGCTPGNQGSGASSGNWGMDSFINDGTNTYTASAGKAGLGIGSNSVGGGNGGAATSVLGNKYGGGGGGGTVNNSNNQNSVTRGSGGAGATANGADGADGNTNTGIGGIGGNGGSNLITVPFLPVGSNTIYFSNGGSGGNNTTGGIAGNSFTSNTSDNGQNSIYGLFSSYGSYGNGGGGGSANTNGSNAGGNGGNGAIIIWY